MFCRNFGIKCVYTNFKFCRIKNEERRAKDEEKRKKEDKRQAEVAAFTSFFLPKKADPKAVEEPKVKAEENFMPFEVTCNVWRRLIIT
jgi:hypothetical protein